MVGDDMAEDLPIESLQCLTFLFVLWIDVREVDRDTLEPILFLLQSPDIEVQRAASAALGNLAVNGLFCSSLCSAIELLLT